jgi:phage-related holin
MATYILFTWVPKSVADHWSIKVAVAVLVYLFGGDRLVHAMYVPFSILMLLDLLTGIWASRKEGHRITSSGIIQKTFKKFAAYATIIIAARMLEHILALAIGTPALGFVSVKIALLYLTVAEATSIDENLRRAVGIGLGTILRRFVKASGVEEDPPPKQGPGPL